MRIHLLSATLLLCFSMQTVCMAEDKPSAWVNLFNGTNLANWVDVNTSLETWSAENGILRCSGSPIGVMRSEKQYENFILEIEWRHLKKKGNSGVFIWSDAVPNPRLPMGMEVQMLELDWINKGEGKRQAHPGYISGELFGAGGLTAIPENPRGKRSMSKEFRCNSVGEWNKYIIVAVDGSVKLSINGKFVNGIHNSSTKRGYLCLESEGSPIEFRNIRIMELPGGILADHETVPEL